ncbi:ABC transporter ATP-binding protein [Nocardioides sp. BP30]|uniref:ABC transporter ATP-binding protein n=1 Tax=Nocardioides sp. BP30 TaxID=3036374 RepID=UPI00246865D0|nr:ABC transporter ATP-binding protein [Nocardioides sp. BP30]WGL53735.1 ABC transporter ATP-binding protein [Nocardioides sp. BP30]
MTEAAAVAPAEAAVSIRGVSRRFGDAIAVNNLELDLAPGEFFALLGPSGCGKTTTLRMVGGFELPSTGAIFLDGHDVTALPAHRRDVNTVFQSYALFPHLTVLENVTFGLRRRGVAKAEAARRAVEYLELVGLAGFDKRRPAQLSGGQQQRVALARALVNHPKVLLLDEPMGALDAQIRKTMQHELKRIQREVGITFLYVTHDQSEAMAMADRLGVMNGGRLEGLGVPEQVYDRPPTQFVAEFLGACNVLPLEVGGSLATLPDGTAVETTDTKTATGPGWRLGIRPEKLQLTASPDPATGPNRIVATVSEVVYLGATSEAHLVTSWGAQLHAIRQNTSATRISAGERVEVAWDASQCFLLPPPGTAGSAAEGPDHGKETAA